MKPSGQRPIETSRAQDPERQAETNIPRQGLHRVFNWKLLLKRLPGAQKESISSMKTDEPELHEDARRLYAQFGFVMRGYTPGFPWWESVELLYKSLLILIAAAFWQVPKTQAALGYLLTVTLIVYEFWIVFCFVTFNSARVPYIDMLCVGYMRGCNRTICPNATNFSSSLWQARCSLFLLANFNFRRVFEFLCS
jgi:hypothetical protein